MLSVKQTDAHWNSIVLSFGTLQHLEAVRLNERGAQRVIYDCLQQVQLRLVVTPLTQGQDGRVESGGWGVYEKLQVNCFHCEPVCSQCCVWRRGWMYGQGP